MRHQVAGKKLNRDKDHRKSLRRNLMNALFLNGQIKTTDAKAKAIRSEVEKIITKAKRAMAHDDPAREVHARRLILARLGNNRAAMEMVFEEYAPRFEDRPGGYTRTFKLGQRKGDAAMIVLMELLPDDIEDNDEDEDEG